MAEETYRHILLRQQADINRYTNPQGGGSSFELFPGLNRQVHGNKIKNDLQTVLLESEELGRIRRKNDIDEKLGIYLTFESHDGFPLNFEKLDTTKEGIELVRAFFKDGKELAVIFVPDGKLKIFFDKLEKYLTKTTKQGNYRYRDVIESIEKIKLSALENFWSDSEAFPIDLAKKSFFEAWLRVGEERDSLIHRFKEQAIKVDIFVSDKALEFPETTVFLIRASINQLRRSVLLLDCLSEFRYSKDSPTFFLNMNPVEEKEWGENLLERVTIDRNHKDIAVCILDTGVNYSHPLLTKSITESDADTYNPNWGIVDHAGHGTEMAGLALYGDLFPLLVNGDPIVLNHSLESVKLLPPMGQNPEDLYGVITEACVARAELLAIERKRIFNLAVTSLSFINQNGEPTSWSAAIDKLAFCPEEENTFKRLILSSAGNLKYDDIKDYPYSNVVNSVQNPAQAWNCLTVGAFTEKSDIDITDYPELTAIANQGDLSPTSTTSLLWNDSNWPIKPEIVMEGGNYAKDKSGFVTSNESLSLITTRRDFQNKLFTMCGDTSAATAQASRHAALVASEYPEFWPETIRGILIHSADYTKLNFENKQIKQLKQEDQIKILRKIGYGHPNLNTALSSGKSICTLIIQDEIQPFIKDGSTIKTNEIKFFNLPLPVVALNQIALEEVQLKVTLSYFIEPNVRKINTKFSKTYSSCALRFESMAGTETIEGFKKRVNKVEREKLDSGKLETGFSNPENDQWVFGSQLRGFGSIHSDVWLGTAAELAKKESVCIYPVGGWWKTRKQLGKYNNKIRFALLVTIKTNSSDVDIYNEIASRIQIESKV
jgi:hypothetical protein